ncbi:hypothetical protein FYZ48_10920 [Gimesia chilikensis]|uniref:hypothetical protein n=1 Tax=Gimesia chilikensis TaxID=2605989 RepID=UPI0011F00B04|nr:hypothetical protein [Gimesia chilikensis]KAA0139148.1 hypothetical protein FYZ48_10920 [Gimesia chilikensis]
MYEGVFDPDTLFTLILLNELEIDPSKPYSSEHGVDHNSPEFRKYQRALVHEKAHYFTLMGSSLFVRRILSNAEISHHLSKAKFKNLRPFVNQSEVPNELLFWFYEYSADSLYFTDLVEGKKIDHSSKVKYLIGNQGLKHILDAYGWGITDLEAVYNLDAFEDASATALVEGIGRAEEYLMLLKPHIGTKIDPISNEIIPEYGHILTEAEIEEEHRENLEDFLSDGSIYTSAIELFRQIVGAAPFSQQLTAFCAFADIALSPPVRTDGSWPSIPAPEFSLEEVLPQTRFLRLCKAFEGRKDIFDFNRKELYQSISSFMADIGWQPPHHTYHLMTERLLSSEKNELTYKKYIDIFGTDPPIREVPEKYEDAITWSIQIRIEAFLQSIEFFKAKCQEPLATAPPYNLELIRNYKLNVRNVIDYDGKGMSQLALALMILKMPALVGHHMIFKPQSECLFSDLDSSTLVKKILIQSVKQHNDCCECAGRPKCGESVFCGYREIIDELEI